MTDVERLKKMRLDWQQGRDWTADRAEGLRQIKRLERKLQTQEAEGQGA
jgi:hypothetical protein